jgi:hypothetical protein
MVLTRRQVKNFGVSLEAALAATNREPFESSAMAGGSSREPCRTEYVTTAPIIQATSGTVVKRRILYVLIAFLYVGVMALLSYNGIETTTTTTTTTTTGVVVVKGDNGEPLVPDTSENQHGKVALQGSGTFGTPRLFVLLLKGKQDDQLRTNTALRRGGAFDTLLRAPDNRENRHRSIAIQRIGSKLSVYESGIRNVLKIPQQIWKAVRNRNLSLDDLAYLE